MKYIVYFNDMDQPDISIYGGKGANLGILTANGFTVPEGFCITTAGYRDYIRHNKIEESIYSYLSEIRTDFDALEELSSVIRNLFTHGTIPLGLRNEVLNAYETLVRKHVGFEPDDSMSVAVRSSATAEDLPGMSFAGQQDTYLNIRGADCLMEAVVNCWSSLWTARAIGYRDKNGINQREVTLSVVVQQMVESEVSGVMFTANPFNGDRDQTVIDAAFGLGEALVSGQVEPDNYIVSRKDKKIIASTLGAKAISIRSDSKGGVSTQAENLSGLQALSDDVIFQLSELGWNIEQVYHCPQDIEWGMVQGKLYILQARPITALIPELYRYEPGDLAHNPDTKKIYLSFASWQVMIDPITPFGRDVFYSLAFGIGRRLGFKTNRRDQNVFATACERLFVNLTPLFRNNLGRKFINLVITSIIPTEEESLNVLFADPKFALKKGRLGFNTKLRLIRELFTIIGILASHIRNADKGMLKFQKTIDAEFSLVENLLKDVKNFKDLDTLFEERLSKTFAALFSRLPAVVASGKMPYEVLVRLVSKIPDCEELIVDLTRSPKHNVTTEMDLELWHVAVRIIANPTAVDIFRRMDAEKLSQHYIQNQFPESVQSALSAFLRTYGARGYGEIDTGRQRWAEDPTQIMLVLKSYIDLSDTASPQQIFDRNSKNAEMALALLVDKIKKSNLNPIKKRIACLFAGRVRELIGLRESPKFIIVRIIKIIREKMLELAQTACKVGNLGTPGDVFFLYIHELSRLSDKTVDLKPLIEERKLLYAGELGRRNIPNLISGDGTIYGASPIKHPSEDGSLCGTPVSAGVVEGTVRVVLDPRVTRLIKDEIMVCPATDPGWTPLFLIASGLIMEVGGVMTHGSVVAREYGIPAIVGVKNATEVLKTGQKVRLNGNNGTIELVE